MSKHLFKLDGPFELEGGGALLNLEITYHTFGTLNADRSNVIWIFHAFSANSDPSDWWNGMVGEGKAIDPNRYFIICANIIGSCYGTTGPLSINPVSSRPYFNDFPMTTVRDTVKALIEVRKSLNIDTIHAGIGFSMGGQQLLEWMIIEPGVIENAILGATNERHSPWGIAFNESQRLAIEADQTFGEKRKDAGEKGMIAARSIALISYRNYLAYINTQFDHDDSKLTDFLVASYQKYQGEKLAARFNAYSYWFLSKAMDSHNISRGRKAAVEVLGSVQTRTCVVGIESDHLFPLREQQMLHDNLPNSEFHAINSDYGHDGFLIESKKISAIFHSFLQEE